MELRAGVDLGGTKIQAIVVGESHKVLGQARAETPRSGGPQAVTEAIAATLTEAATAANVGTPDLVGIGVGSPGAVDAAAGTVQNASNLADWQAAFPLGPQLAKLAGAPVAIGNDVQVATDAEFQLGAAKPFDSLLGVFWGTGVGGGLVLDRRDWLGRGAAGEFGHTIVKAGGAKCACGNRGCVEAYAGRAAMEARARKRAAEGHKTDLLKIAEHKGKDRFSSSVWAKALEDGDEMATELIDRAVDALGTGIASAVNLLDLEAVVIGGGLGTRLGQPYVDRIEAKMRKSLFVKSRPPELLLAELGDLGGAIGASLLVATQARGST